MSTSSPAASASPPPIADPQDPLPESNWLWRRIFVFFVLAALLAGAWFKVDVIGQVALGGNTDAILGLIELIKWALALSGILMLFYLVSPSAEQVVKMLATVQAWKGGVSTTSAARSTAPDGSTAAASTSAGPARPAAPAAPAGVADEIPDYAR